MNILAYDFMRKAFLAGIPLAAIISCIGVIVVLKRLSMIGDALAHTSLAGVAAGLLMGFNPVVGAIVTSMLAALGVEAVRKKIPKYAELSVAITMSAGVGLAGVLSGLPGAGNFNSYLFGSIISIDNSDLNLVAIVSLLVMLVFLLMYKELFYIAFDERSARLAGVKVGLINTVITLLTAITVSVAARIVGALIVSSLMAIPIACSMRIAKSYRQTLMFSVLFAIVFTVTGLSLSFYLSLRPGAAIVLTGCLVLTLMLILSGVKSKSAKSARLTGGDNKNA